MTFYRGAVLALYLCAIVFANVITATHAPLTVELVGETWVIPWGTFAIAVTFFARDLVQLAVGRLGAYVAIGVALAATVGLSAHYHDLFWVTVASTVSFAVSETLDTEVFTRLRGSLAKRVALSGVVGGTIDSAFFAVVGLSPLTTGIVPWRFLWTTIVAQVVIKCALNVIVAIPVARTSPARLEVEAA